MTDEHTADRTKKMTKPYYANTQEIKLNKQ